MPQRLAGCRILPPVSVPVAKGEMRAATAAAEPPEEPPGTLLMSQGLGCYHRGCRLVLCDHARPDRTGHDPWRCLCLFRHAFHGALVFAGVQPVAVTHIRLAMADSQCDAGRASDCLGHSDVALKIALTSTPVEVGQGSHLIQPGNLNACPCYRWHRPDRFGHC